MGPCHASMAYCQVAYGEDVDGFQTMEVKCKYIE
jgi:hypothetical protein